MSLYDDTNPNHVAYLERWRAIWTPEKEAALQREFAARGIGRHAKESTR